MVKLKKKTLLFRFLMEIYSTSDLIYHRWMQRKFLDFDRFDFVNFKEIESCFLKFCDDFFFGGFWKNFQQIGILFFTSRYNFTKPLTCAFNVL